MSQRLDLLEDNQLVEKPFVVYLIRNKDYLLNLQYHHPNLCEPSKLIDYIYIVA